MNFLRKLYRRLHSSEFLLNFRTLSLGSFLAKAITLITYPIITRIYSPEEFGIFSVYLSITTVLASVSMFRYEIAVVTADNDTDSKNLFILSVFLSLSFSIIVLFFIFFGEVALKNLLNANSLNFWWYSIPFGIFLLSLKAIISNYLNRFKNYFLISKLEIIKAFFYSIIVITIGYIGFTDSGFFIAEILSLLIFIVFIVNLKKFWNISYFKTNINFFILLKKYSDFPRYGLIATFLNNLTTMMPIFFLNKFFAVETVGQYVLAVKVFFFPLRFISSSLSKINLRKSKELIDNKGDLKKYLMRLSLILFFIIIGPCLICIYFAPEIFSAIFGKKWEISGTYTQILAPAISLIFIVSTLSSTLYSTKKIHLNLIWNLIYFTTMLLFFYSQSENSNIENVLFNFSYIILVMYGLYFIIIFYSIRDFKIK